MYDEKCDTTMKKILFGLCLLLLLGACNRSEKEARMRLEKAQASYEQNDLFAAKQQIDSIRELYPSEYKVIREGLQLMRRIEVKEQMRNIAYCDSVLPVRLQEAEELKKNFVLEKDTAYNPVGNYIFKGQTIERNIGRSYIRCGVTETGEMYIASVYYGNKPLGHTHIKVSTDDALFAETVPIAYDGGNNYRFEDMGMTTEVVTYAGDKGKDAVKLIYANPDERIKVEYLGGKPYVLYMADADKKALRATYDFASVLNDIEHMTKSIEKGKKKLEYLQKKLSDIPENNTPLND